MKKIYFSIFSIFIYCGIAHEKRGEMLENHHFIKLKRQKTNTLLYVSFLDIKQQLR